MDFLRSCYRSNMRLFPDRPDVVTPGRWYFCPPGAKPIPYEHAFGSRVWLDTGAEYDPPIGEVGARGAWTDGAPPSWATGQHWCGEAAVWAGGIPYADRPGLLLDGDGVPQCCPRTPPPMGGLAATFTSTPTLPRKLDAWAALGFASAKAPESFSVAADLAVSFEMLEAGLLHSASAFTSGVPLDPAVAVTAEWTAVEWDTDAIFDLGADPTLATIPLSGVWLVGFEGAVIHSGAAAAGEEYAGRVVFPPDGTPLMIDTVNALQPYAPAGSTRIGRTELHLLNAGDTLVLNFNWLFPHAPTSTFTGRFFLKWEGPLP